MKVGVRAAKSLSVSLPEEHWDIVSRIPMLDL